MSIIWEMDKEHIAIHTSEYYATVKQNQVDLHEAITSTDC